MNTETRRAVARAAKSMSLEDKAKLLMVVGKDMHTVSGDCGMMGHLVKMKSEAGEGLDNDSEVAVNEMVAVVACFVVTMIEIHGDTDIASQATANLSKDNAHKLAEHFPELGRLACEVAGVPPQRNMN